MNRAINTLITPILLILVSVGLFWLYIDPTYSATTGSADRSGKSIKELQSERQNYADALDKTRQIELARDGLLAKYNQLSESNRQKISKMLPDNVDSVRLIIDINNIAQKYGMSLSDLLVTANGTVPSGNPAPSAPAASFSPGSGASGQTGSYGSIKLGFSVTGTYDSLIMFLKELENSLRVVDVASLHFKSIDKNAPNSNGVQQAQPVSSNVQPVYTYELTIRTYYLN